MRILIFFLFLCTITIINCGCHKTIQPEQEEVYFQDFDNLPFNSQLPKDWWFEGTSSVKVSQGRLFIDANPDNSGEDFETSTIWINHIYSGNISIEFDVHVLASEGDKNNINFFFLYSHPSGEPLIETKNERNDAAYKKYHDLNGYIFTFLAGGHPEQGRFRMRFVPGFVLLKEKYAYECRQGKTYHIKITKKDGVFFYAVDGITYLKGFSDYENKAHEAGIMGFRTWRTELWIDNLKIIKMK